MGEPTRRGFLALAGAGAAATAGVVLAAGDGATGQATATSGTESTDNASSATESFVVHVKDARRGQMAILVGEREVLVTNPELARQLAGEAASGAV
ncbi:hypothetical protein GCM10009765_21870 [Fodinicola feengrottensis]|uniref:Twin-arginine translocation signal domain-containing protein n=1 Tax=Fodinicola feengrottensis TaxID=435914 RepID=A0ABN2GJ32_9ACTN